MTNYASFDAAQAALRATLTGPDAECLEALESPSWSRDRLDRLPYERRCGNGSTHLGLSMGGYWVEKYIIEHAWKLFWQNPHRLAANRKHTTVALCGDPAWTDRRLGERIKIGRCFKYLAAHGVLPITLANSGKSGPRKYFLHKGYGSQATVH